MKPFYTSSLKAVKFFLVLSCMLCAGFLHAQVFWTENFGTGCTQLNFANTYVGPNGAWSVTNTGANGTSANDWFVSATEAGMGAGNCGNGCVNNAALTNRTLHIANIPGSPSSILCPTGDCGAAYDAGVGNGVVVTDKRAESPTINCSGQTGITLNFVYMEAGQGATDHMTVWYFDGATWTQIANPLATNNTGCAGQGRWTAVAPVALPASANNNANVKIGFRWVNNDDGAGNDPSIGIDDVTLSGSSSGAPVAAFSVSSTNVCVGQGVNFTDNSTGGPTSWSWTFPSGTPASATTQNVNGVVWNTAGTYTVTLTATNSNGSSSSTQVITVNPLPTVTVSASSSSICTGSSTTLTAAGASTYSWQPGNLSGTSVTVTPASTTTYTVTGTSAAGCTNTATITITVNPIPTVTASASSTTICQGAQTTLTGGGASTYTWQPGNLTGTNVTVSPGATTTYTVTGTSAAGCTNTATITITVIPCSTPIVNFTVSDSTICVGDCINFFDQSTNGPTTWNWTFNGAATPSSTLQNPTNICYLTAGSFAVTLVANNPNGSGSLTKTSYIVVDPQPVANAGNDTAICSGQQATLHGSGGGTYTWQPGNLNGSTVIVSPGSTTTYTLTVTDANGCTNTDNITVTVQPCSVPTAAFATSSNNFCEGNCINFTDNSVGGPTSWNWQFPGGTPSSSTQQNPTNICYNTPGVYSVTLIVTNSFGTDTLVMSNYVTVNAPTPVNAGPFVTIAIGNSTQLNATAGGGGSYSWSPPNGLSNPNIPDPVANPTVTTTYTVTFTEPDGCTSSDTVTVEVIEFYSLYVPSAFSPNGDGTNDILFVRGAGIKTLDFVVYDRWGEKVFESTDKDVGWDGTFRGQPMNTGVFDYYVKVEFYNATSQVLKGDVSLVR